MVTTWSYGAVAMAPRFGCSNVQVFARGKGLAAVTADSRPHGGADVLDVGGSGGTATALPVAGCGAATCTALWTTALGPVAAPPVIASGSLPVATAAAVTAFRLPAA